MPPFDRAQISIHSGLVFGVVVLVLLTASLVHVPWSLSARRNVTDLALALNRQLIENASTEMNVLLEDAVATEQILATMIGDHVIDIDHSEARKTLFRTVMESRSTLSEIQFGWLDDRSISVLRSPDGVLQIRETDPGLADASAVSRQFWFKQAFETTGASWSDIYRLSNGELGFTVLSKTPRGAVPVGVLGVSLELRRISTFLNSIRASRNGAVFLTNGYQELVATQNQDMARAYGEKRAIIKLEEATTPLMKIAATAIKAQALELRELRNLKQITYTAGGATYFVTLVPLTQMGLLVGLIVPESDILGDIHRSTTTLGYCLLLFVGLITALVAWLARRTLGQPLIAVTSNARLLGDLRLDEIKPVTSRLTELRSLSHTIAQMSASLASFKKYIPTEIVRTLLAQGLEAELGGEHRTLSIFFMDLAHFTKVSEALGDALIPVLSEYLSAMSAEIKETGGTIDKYIGDAVMSFWGAPVRQEDHALSACRAALACQARLARLRQSDESFKRIGIRARIGINTGRVLVGNVGSRDRLNYTIIGDPVNVASRLEALNKRYGTEILIGADTYADTMHHIIARGLDRVAVYGKAKGIEVFELLALAQDASPALLTWVAIYERGMSAFRARAWREAEACFMQVIALRGGTDKPSSNMIGRIRELQASPPAPDWDGIVILSDK